MSTPTQDRVETQRQQIRSGAKVSSPVPRSLEYEGNSNSKASALRPTDSEEHQQTTGRDASAGWRAEYRHQGVEPEGWRR
jgi:hypothetical protein